MSSTEPDFYDAQIGTFIRCEREGQLECTGHYFENEQCRGLDYCDGSSDVQHSDKTYWHHDADGTETRLTDDSGCERITP